MKKVLFTLSILLMVGMLTAQQNTYYTNKKVPKVEVGNQSAAEMQENLVKLQKHVKTRDLAQAQSSKAIKSRWYNPAFAIDNDLGNIGTISANNLFPDSTILVDYTSGYASAWIHSIAECVDPCSDWYSDGANELDINKYMPYTVDSIAIYGIYLRDLPDVSVVDTLLIQVRQTTGSYRFWESSSAPSIYTDYGTDTLAYRPVNHDTLKNYSTESGVVTIKYPLDASSLNDTVDGGWNYFSVDANDFAVDAGRQLIVTFGFIPGYSWTANVDTIERMNRFRFVSMEEMGDNGGLGTYPTYTKWDWTCSFIQSKENLYGDAPYIYASPYGFVETYSYEHHWMEVKLTADETILPQVQNTPLEEVQNYPNPFRNSTTLVYNLLESNNVSLEVYSITGALLYTQNEGRLNAGSYKAELPLSALEAGVYYVKINAGSHSVSKKMIKY